MRTSKYLGKVFDNGWKCTHVGIATVQGKNAKGAYHRGYYYLLERTTSDGKCEKQIRVNAAYMAKIGRGELLAEEVENRIAKRHSKLATKKVNYSFN